MASHWKLATIRRRFILCCPLKSSLAIFCSYFLYCAYMFTFGYPVNLCPYLWLPCHSVFLPLATMSFCIIIPGYPVFLYSYLCLPCHSLYYYHWLPSHSVFLSLATMSFCILISCYLAILYSYLWLPCHSVFLSLATLSFGILASAHFVSLSLNRLLVSLSPATQSFPCMSFLTYFPLPCHLEPFLATLRPCNSVSLSLATP